MTVLRTRNSRITIASPIAASETVMQMVKTENTMPMVLPAKRENAIRLMLTALSISSMPSRMPTVLRRVTTPNSPMQKTTALRIRYACRPMAPLVLGAREIHRAQHGGQHQHPEQLEGQHELRQHAFSVQ